MARFDDTKILPYEPAQELDGWPTDEAYHYWSSDTSIFENMTARWHGQQARLEEVTRRILANDHLWDETLRSFNGLKPIDNIESGGGGIATAKGSHKYKRDLRGLKFSYFKLNRVNSAWHYTRLEFSDFEFASFIGSEASNFGQGFFFFQNNLSHSRFSNSIFQSMIFRGGNCNNVVFIMCTFRDVMFKSNQDEPYQNIIFSNCKFSNVNFLGIDIRKCCFLGYCEFDKMVFEPVDFYSFHPIGEKLIKQFSEWDSSTWTKRRRIKTINYSSNSVTGISRKEITYHEEGYEETSRLKRFQTQINCYRGLSKFYEYIAQNVEQLSDQEAYIHSHFVLQWLRDQIKLLEKGKIVYPKIFLSRGVLGYGDRPERPLILWLLLVFLCSFLYLFTGVSSNGQPVTDWLTCLYFSVITSTTVGYGDIQPAGGLSRFLSSVLSVLGLLLFTMFTVIFARRFFR